MFINIHELVRGNTVRKDGFDFISITKTITNETMGQTEKNLFHSDDIEEIKKQNASSLFLQVNQHNNAKIFYEKLGFNEVDFINLDIGNGYFMNDYIMEKKF